MSNDKYKKLIENIKLKNRLYELGIGCTVIGPTGPKGDKGDTGPVALSSNEGLFFTSFLDTNSKGSMILESPWLIPNDSVYFILKNNNQVQIQPGIYEITLSGLIDEVDDSHGVIVYLMDNNSSAIKSLIFKLEAGNVSQMSFSQTIIFRFENITTLECIVDILGNYDTSNVNIKDVNLLMKKIHE